MIRTAKEARILSNKGLPNQNLATEEHVGYEILLACARGIQSVTVSMPPDERTIECITSVLKLKGYRVRRVVENRLFISWNNPEAEWPN